MAQLNRVGRVDVGETITSAQNARIKAVVALRDRRDREREGRIVIDGAREILRALRSGVAIEALFVNEALCRSEDCEDVLTEAARRRIPRSDVGDRAFEKLAFGERSEGVVAVARRPSVAIDDLRPPPDPLLVVLEGVEKPGNLGAILRSADGAGADALIVAEGGTDLFNPNAIRASVGTIFHVPLAAAPTPDVLAWLRAHRVRIVATRVDGARPYTEVDYRGPVAIVLGSEAEGLTASWAGADIEPVSLPMDGIADSLNVSVAAAVMLYEARRQRAEVGARVGTAKGAKGARAGTPKAGTAKSAKAAKAATNED